METQARFLLIGAVTLAAALGVAAFVVWLAGVGPARETVAYDVVFDGVAGLDVDAEVVFSGLPVGRVTALALDGADPTRVRARIEVLDETPVTRGTVAQLGTQGVTGLSYVALSGGTGEPLDAPEGEVPTIPSVRSAVQALFDETPDVVAESAALLRELQGFATPDNQARVARILADLEGATAAVRTLAETAAPAAGRIADASDELALAAADLRALAAPLGEAVEAAEGAFTATAATAEGVDRALAAAEPALPGLIERADAVLALAEMRLVELEGLPGAVAALEGAGRGVEAAARDDVPALAADARAAAASLAALSGELAEDLPRLTAQAGRLMSGADEDLDRVGRVTADIGRLVTTLDRIARRVERDPTGFILRGSRR
jgi:phospholipid/cholesterol/gamma-HCH transport system substrate-binding protein